MNQTNSIIDLTWAHFAAMEALLPQDWHVLSNSLIASDYLPISFLLDTDAAQPPSLPTEGLPKYYRIDSANWDDWCTTFTQAMLLNPSPPSYVLP